MTEKTLLSSHIFHSKSEPPKSRSMCKHITFLECSDGEAEIVSTTTLSKNQNEIDLLAVDLPALSHYGARAIPVYRDMSCYLYTV
jgi:hypothetical protein